VHMPTHTSEKPFKCSECSFAASEAGTLKRHTKAKHAVREAAECSPLFYNESEATCTSTVSNSKKRKASDSVVC
jgi:hypothetical protein